MFIKVSQDQLLAFHNKAGHKKGIPKVNFTRCSTPLKDITNVKRHTTPSSSVWRTPITSKGKERADIEHGFEYQPGSSTLRRSSDLAKEKKGSCGCHLSEHHTCTPCTPFDAGSEAVGTKVITNSSGRRSRSDLAELYADWNTIVDDVLPSLTCAKGCKDKDCLSRLKKNFDTREFLNTIRNNLREFWGKNQGAAQDYLVRQLEFADIQNTGKHPSVQGIRAGGTWGNEWVCGRMFQAIHGLLDKNTTWYGCLARWKNKQEMGYAGIGRPMDQTSEDCIQWWRWYATTFGEAQPNLGGDIHLEKEDIKSVYENDYCPQTEAEERCKPIPLSSFYKCFDKACAMEPRIHVVEQKGTSAKCNLCSELKLSLVQAGRDTQKRGQVLHALKEHKKDWGGERLKYWQTRQEGRNWDRISISIDGKATWKTYYPFISRKFQSVASKSFKHTVDLNLVSVVVHGWKTLYFQVPDWVQKKDNMGGGIIATLIHTTLQKLCEAAPWEAKGKRMPSELNINWDGGSENRNHSLYGYIHHMAEELTDAGVFDRVNITRLPVGHTHNDNDQEFGVIDGYLETPNPGGGFRAVTSWEEWVQHATKALTQHKAKLDTGQIKHGYPEFHIIGAAFDMHNWLQSCYDPEYKRFASTRDYVGGEYDIIDGRAVNFDPDNMPEREDFRCAKSFYMQFFRAEGKLWHRATTRIVSPDGWWPSDANMTDPVAVDPVTKENIYGYRVLLRKPKGKPSPEGATG